MSRTAAAPSVSGLALPAVTVPSRLKTGLSVASFSTLVFSRTRPSRVTPATGTTSRSNRPDAMAAAARRCERTANSSWAWRVMP
ncbi:Uncharacterised protein [Mycobacteroides abscessus subsp. abscessus]|nr:Uncharacterised protein [Mycobacteroides abscessus subsp. abscessus]